MILKELPIGSKVREQKSAVVFLVADHNHTAYTGTTLVTDGAVKVASFDAAEPHNPVKAVKEFGNNLYHLSNIHQWLNANETDWYKPTHEFDAPPVSDNIDMGRLDFYDIPFYSEEAKFTGDFSYNNDAGFLTWFAPEFVDSIGVVTVQCYVEPKPGVVHTGPVTPYNLKAKVFLLSAPEMGFESRTTEGFRFPLFNEPRMRVVAPIPAAIHRPVDYVYDDCSFWYWLRTPFLGTNCMATHYNSDHKVGDYNPLSTSRLPARAISGIRPALNLDSNVMISEPDNKGIHTLLFGGK